MKRIIALLASLAALLFTLPLAPAGASTTPKTVAGTTAFVQNQYARLALARARMVAATAQPILTQYRVVSGDTLSKIAAAKYGSPLLWPSLWYVNRGTVKNPNAITVGETLTLSSWHPSSSQLTAEALAAIPKPVVVVTSAPAPVPQPGPATVPTQGMTSFESCVIQRESGGNPQVMNSSGHYGLFQFSQSTWDAAGGDPSLFGHASASYQMQVFAMAYSKWGTSPWAPYDGC